jgi:predicted nucleic acid-binding protein
VAFVDEWLAQPYVSAVSAGQGRWTILRKLLRDSGTAGNLTSDAHLAAVALEILHAIRTTLL